MTNEEIEAWEQRMLDEHDLTDLADCVQLLRVIGWSAALALKIGGDAMIWYRDLHEFAPVIEQLRRIGRADDDPERRSQAMALARLYAAVHDALAAGPRQPSEEEVLRRYVNGEIGDRTAQYVLEIDPWGLIEACRKHDLPPIQIGDDKE